MITAGDRISGLPVIISKKGASRPRQVSFTKKLFDEEWIQELIAANPETLPIDDIDPVFCPLICIGREVETDAGYIDNLYISPEGYLTIVETKLWRNPEARREVVGQIIDYAKDISSWTYTDLENQVKCYNKLTSGKEMGIIDTIRKFTENDLIDEKLFVDTISRNLARGRFLLLIVGDGIREGVERMVEYMSQTPQLHFNLALVELQVYEMEDSEQLLVIPQIVTRTKEIVRAVVKLEGVSVGSVKVDVDTMPEVEKNNKRKRSLDEEEFFENLKQNTDQKTVEFARKIIADAEELGCFIKWRRASFAVRYFDPMGSKRKYTLFLVTQDGRVQADISFWLLEELGLSKSIGTDYASGIANIFPDCSVKNTNPAQVTRTLTIDEVRENYNKFLPVISKTISQIKTASEELLVTS
jgi:uncharacterized protein YlzI (FlbEa/FlbD family)